MIERPVVLFTDAIIRKLQNFVVELLLCQSTLYFTWSYEHDAGLVKSKLWFNVSKCSVFFYDWKLVKGSIAFRDLTSENKVPEELVFQQDFYPLRELKLTVNSTVVNFFVRY